MTRLRGIPLDTCEACGEIQFDGIKCHECGSMSGPVLHDKVKADLAKITRERWQPYDELKRTGTGGWL
jgi:hypothetical protein